MGNGQSSSNRPQVSVVDIVNPSIKERWWRKTIHLQPHWDSTGDRLAFLVDPDMHHGQLVNPFKGLHDKLQERGSYAIITELSLKMQQNDFDEPIEIEFSHIFDRDESMDDIRDRIAQAQENQEQEDEFMMSGRAPNRVEVNNALKFTLIESMETHNVTKLYYPSLKDSLIRALAGQERNFLHPSTELLLGEISPETTQDELFKRNHPLIAFMQRHRETLALSSGDIRVTGRDGSYYEVKSAALRRVRTFLVAAGYTRLYRSTFACTSMSITRKPEHTISKKQDIRKGRAWLKRVSFLIEVKYYEVRLHAEDGDPTALALRKFVQMM